MNRRALVATLWAVALAFACKSTGSGVNTSEGKPDPSYSGTQATYSCAPVDATTSTVTCTIDFGGVPIGQSVTSNLSIGNDSASSYEITAQTPPTQSQYTVQQLQNLPVEVVTNVALAVTFKPFNEDEVTDSFSISTDSTTISKIVFNLKGSGVKLAIAINPTNIDFGKVIIHSSQSIPLTIYNLSTGDITLSPITPQGVSQSLFTVTPPANYSYSDSIPPDPMMANGKVFTVTFTPTAQSYADENAYLVVSYAPNKYLNVGLKGFGVKSGLLVTTSPVATPSTSPNISFGHIPLLQSVTDHITVQNISNQVIKLFYCYLSNSAGGAFTVGTASDPGSAQVLRTSSTPLTMQPGDSLDYPITFAPVLGQGYNGAFAIQSDHSDNITVPITGGGGGPAISCVTLPATPPPLALDFGYVAVNIGATLSLLCTNDGNDIYINGKLDTSGELLVYQSELQINQPASSYSAQLLDEDLQPTGFISARSGQQFEVAVTYNPIAATTQVEPGTLLIPNNTSLTPVLTVSLGGQALKLTDCDLSISPNNLNFEQVTTGQTVALPVTLTNVGNNPCLINGLSLSPTTDPSYSLVTTPSSSIRLDGTNQPPPGDGGVNGPTSYQTLVQFHPTSPGAYDGLINFVISSKAAPNQLVPLKGTAGDGCLILTPQEADFGNVGIKTGDVWCHTKSHTFTALNTCNYPVQVTGLSDSVQTVDFKLTSSPSLPVVVQPGQFFQFTEEFAPLSAGVKWGSAVVTASPVGGTAVSYLLGFHGNADTDQQVDTYAIPPAKVDILWVVDYADMYDMYCALVPSVTDSYGYTYTCPNSSSSNFMISNLTNFFNGLSGVDYHLAVISSVDCLYNENNCIGCNEEFADDMGQIVPCTSCSDSNSNTAQIITSSDADPLGELTGILNTMIVNGMSNGPYFEYYGICETNFNQEYFNGADVFQPAYLAMQSNLLNGHNSGFLRDDAALTIIGFNNSDDQSQMVSGNPQPFYYAFFENLKGYNPLTPFIFNAISITPAETAAQVYDCSSNTQIYLNTCYYCYPPGTDTNIPTMVQETGGQLVDICTSDWAGSLTNLGTVSSAKPVTFTINGSPVNPPDGISVSINGGPPIPQYTRDGGAAVWVYNAQAGTLTFPNSANAPGPGDVLTISYTNICY